MLSTTLVALAVIFVARRLYLLFISNHGVNEALPNITTPIPTLSIPSALVPTIRSLNHHGLCYSWDNRATLYKDAQLKTVILKSWAYGGDFVYTTNISAFHQILGLNNQFEKPEDGMRVLNFMGINVVTANADVWKRHRRITAPSFNQTTYRSVWETTVKVYSEMVEKEGWDNVQETGIVAVNKITHKLALFIIAIVGFGIPMSWFEPSRDEQGRLSMQTMIFDVSAYILARSRIPKTLYALGIPFLNRVDEAYKQFDIFMHEQIGEREAELKKVRSMPGATEEDVSEAIGDVFGRLVNARLSDGKLTMSDEEITGNCFIFVFAGHETTANTLSATLGLLAIYQETQDYVFQSIKDVVGDREPCFEDFDALEGVLACFYEGLRLFPAAYLMVRQPKEDTVLNLPRKDDQAIIETLHMKKGTTVVLDTVGLSYDPQVFPDPESFNPRRWIKQPHAAGEKGSSLNMSQADEVALTGSASALAGFMGFSFGPRTCLGHKFSKIEAVAFLTYLLNNWRIMPVMKDGETREQWRERVLKPHFGVALSFGDVPLKFVRRK